MDPNQEIISELKALNEKLDKVTKPSKLMWTNFLSGTFRSLGMLFGTIIIGSILIYIFSQVDFTKSVSKWVEDTLSQIRWEKIVTPQNEIIEQK
ncbi:MAG: DUF5665 domain-containing protein [Candidatus Shapirobacteria bacterium]